MRQDARHRTPPDEPGAPVNAVTAFAAPDASGQFRIELFPRPRDRDQPDLKNAAATLGRIGPRTLPRPPRDWHARGVELERANDLDGAIEHYRRALLERGPDAQISFDLAHALAQRGHTQQAIERYRQVVELDPRRADAWANLADCLIDDDQLDAGLDALHRALDIDPHDAATHYNLADALYEAGDVEQSVAHFRTFLHLTDLDGDDAHVRYAWSRLRAD